MEGKSHFLLLRSIATISPVHYRKTTTRRTATSFGALTLGLETPVPDPEALALSSKVPALILVLVFALTIDIQVELFNEFMQIYINRVQALAKAREEADRPLKP